MVSSGCVKNIPDDFSLNKELELPLYTNGSNIKDYPNSINLNELNINKPIIEKEISNSIFELISSSNNDTNSKYDLYQVSDNFFVFIYEDNIVFDMCIIDDFYILGNHNTGEILLFK